MFAQGVARADRFGMDRDVRVEAEHIEMYNQRRPYYGPRPRPYRPRVPQFRPYGPPASAAASGGMSQATVLGVCIFMFVAAAAIAALVTAVVIQSKPLSTLLSVDTVNCVG